MSDNAFIKQFYKQHVITPHVIKIRRFSDSAILEAKPALGGAWYGQHILVGYEDTDRAGWDRKLVFCSVESIYVMMQKNKYMSINDVECVVFDRSPIYRHADIGDPFIGYQMFIWDTECDKDTV